MKRYLRKPDYESGDVEKIRTTESVEVDIETYDISNDSDDTYYSFDSLEEYRRWLQHEEN